MGSYALSDAILQVYRTLRDVGDLAEQQKLTDTEIASFVTQATRRYSIDRPLLKVEDATGADSRDVALPATYEDGFSVLISVEYPVDADPERYVDDRYWTVYRAPTGPVLRFRGIEVAGTESARLTYTIPAVIDAVAVNTTVPDGDFYTVMDLAVSLSADAIASGYGFTHDPVIATDVTNYRTKVDEWQSIAKRYERRYQEAMRIANAQGSAVLGTSSFLNWDSRASDGYDRLTHPARLR